MNGKVASMDPIDRTAVPKIQQTAEKVREHEEKFLSTNELNDVLSLIRKDYPFLADIFDFQARTGLRFGELAALREEDYDGNNIDVNATLCWTGRRKDAHRGTPKNAYSVRRIELDRRSKHIVENFILRNKQRRQWFKRCEEPMHYIFTTSKGGPIDIAFANRVLRKLNYKKKLSTHIFRHTHISLLAERGVPLKAIMARVGHNDPATTMSIYTHVTDTMSQAAVRAMDAIK